MKDPFTVGIILLGSLAVVIQLFILVYVVDMVLWITQ